MEGGSDKRKKPKKHKPKKLMYLADEDNDEELLDFIVYDVKPDNFSPTDLCSDQFLNLCSDENLVYQTYFEDEEDDEGGHVDDVVHENVDDEKDVGGDEQFPVHDPALKWSKMKPVIGELYESPAQLRFALTNYAVANEYQLWFCKRDARRLIAKCGRSKDKKTECPFRVYATWKSNERTFQIKSMIETHLCERDYKFGYLVSCNWLAKQYLKVILRYPKMTLPEMKADILRKFSVEVSISQCHRARVRAREMIEGKLEEHYGRVWDYANEVLKSNPGSTCKVGVTVNPDVNYFQRFYVCFKGFRDGWKQGCRPVIGLDGCFLNGQVKGELLTAIGRDGNNHVYPIAWAVVNIENKDNWTWFLELLVADLGFVGGEGLVIISDQHKGLIQAVKDIMPHVEYRQCARHVYANTDSVPGKCMFVAITLHSSFTRIDIRTQTYTSVPKNT